MKDAGSILSFICIINSRANIEIVYLVIQRLIAHINLSKKCENNDQTGVAYGNLSKKVETEIQTIQTPCKTHTSNLRFQINK